MQVEEIKQRLHLYIDSIKDENVLMNLLSNVEKDNPILTNEEQELSKDDYEDLLALINEPPEKDTISYDEFKSSLSRWFTK